MKFKRGLTFFLALILAFTPVMVSAAELSEDVGSEDVGSAVYYKHVITLEKNKVSAKPGQNFELKAKVTSTKINETIPDPNAYAKTLGRNEILTEGQAYSCDFIWGPQKEGQLDPDYKKWKSGENLTTATLSAPDAEGNYKYMLQVNSTSDKQWDGFNDYDDGWCKYLQETINLTVTNEEEKPELNTFSISPTAKELYKGDTFSITYTAAPKEALKDVTFAVTGTKGVATVNATSGKVTATGIGTTEITATATDKAGKTKKATCIVTVKEKSAEKKLVKEITLKTGNKKVLVGKTRQIKADVKPSDADNKNVTWTTSNKKVATVDKNGKVTAKKPGKAKIRATAKDGSGVYGEIEITVVEIKPGVSEVIVKKGAKKSFDVKVANDTLDKVTSSDTKKAKVSFKKSGKKYVVTVKAQNKTGTPKITLTTKSGLKQTIKVTVKKYTTEKIELIKNGKAKSSVSVKKGKTVKYTIKATPSKDKTKEKPVISKKPDKDIATASITSKGELKVKGVKKGTTKVTIKIGGIEKTYTIKVKK